MVHDNTEYGTSVATVITSVFKENGQNIALDIAYAANATDVQSQVLQLKEKKPDVVIMISLHVGCDPVSPRPCRRSTTSRRC